MHLANPGLTTTSSGTSKKKLNVKQERAKQEHDAWLRKQGLHPDQIAAKKSNAKKKLKLDLVVNKGGPQCTNGFTNGGFRTSVFDSNWNRRYEDDPKLAEREALALRKAEALKADLLPLYNKGPIQLRPKGLKMDELGKRR